VATVQISLVREHTAAMRPPRALWVPFVLGRPLGVPDDPAFQTRVLRAALSLFERERGPVLEDYPEDAPPVEDEASSEGMACAIDFSRPRADSTLREQVHDEVVQLQAWHDLFVRRRGRTSFGLAGEAPVDLVRRIARMSEEPDRPGADRSEALALRLACEDLKAFYLEARLAQPGPLAPDAMQRWFWFDTAAGRLYFELASATARSADPTLRHFAAKNLLPRIALDGPPVP
jgi:hypothetical protein